MLARDQDTSLRTERFGDLPAIIHTSRFDQASEFIDQVLAGGAGLYLLCGEPEVGKTTVIEYCCGRADDSVNILTQSLRRIDADNLAALLNEAFGVPANTSLEPQGLALRYFLKLGTLHSKGQRFVVILDDVETIHSSGAELIKALLHMKAEKDGLLTIILCGETSLSTVLDKSYRWGVQKFIKQVFHMKSLDLVESGKFVEKIAVVRRTKPVAFNHKAKTLLYRLAEGIPGKLLRVGHLAGKIANRFNESPITPKIIEAAASKENLQMKSETLTSNWKWYAIAVAFVLVVPIVLWTQQLFEVETIAPSSQRLPEDENRSPEQAATLLPQKNGTIEVKPDIATVEDNIYTGEIAAVTESLALITDQIQSPAFRLSIPNHRETVLMLIQGADTVIPGQPE